MPLLKKSNIFGSEKDYEKQQTTMLSIAQSLFAMPNLAQQRQEQEVLGFLEVKDDNNKMEEEKL